MDATDLANELDFDLMARHRGLEAPHFFRRSHRNWELRRTGAEEGGMEVRRFQIVTPSMTLTKEDSRPLAGAATAGLSFTPTKPLLSGREEIECFLEHLPALDDTDLAHIRETVAGWKRVVDAIHAAGAFTIYHNCGFARSLYANYAEVGMTAWETVAEPPRGDNRLADAKAAIGGRICLVGNIDQVDFLKRATPAEVDARTREIVRAGKPGGRFIFAASDFLEKNTPLANVRAMIAAAKDEGRYGV